MGFARGIELINTLQKPGSGVTWCGGRRCSTRVDFLMRRLGGDGWLHALWVDYEAAIQLQLSSALNWLDHAPVRMDWRYRCWYDIDSAHNTAGCTRAQSALLKRSPVLQQRLCDLFTERLTTNQDLLAAAQQQGAVDAYWALFNTAARDAWAELRPQVALCTR